MLDELKTAEKVVGIKQLQKALNAGRAKKVFLAADADPALTGPVEASCREAGIEIVLIDTMQQLGAACGIPVSAAAAAIV